jgi:hypothetical protein
MPARSGLQDEAAVAIGTFDEVFLSYLEIDARMAQRAADALALHAGVVDFDDLGGVDGHDGYGGSGPVRESGRILALKSGTSSAFAEAADRL